MCTAITYPGKDYYFGRTLDYEKSFGEEVVITPRHFRFEFRKTGDLQDHYAMIGMAKVEQNYPLYYEATNEKGLSMAGLNFPGNADYKTEVKNKDNIAPFEFIPWILGQCENVEAVKRLLKRINLIRLEFSNQLSLSPLHWIIADEDQAITVESVKEGLCIYENSIGVLTNNPPFDMQLFNLNNYIHLSKEAPVNEFSKEIELSNYSRGMGAIGLPGDLSSASRFVRAAFTKLNSVSGNSEAERVSQFFHILETVSQTRGCVDVGNGEYEKTIYTSCCNINKGIYYYTTYENRQITAIDMYQENLNGKSLMCFPLIREQQIYSQNAK